MGILKVLANVGKAALKQTIGINLDQLKKGAELDSKLERKVHELTVILSQLFVSVMLLWKFGKDLFPAKSIKNQKR